MPSAIASASLISSSRSTRTAVISSVMRLAERGNSSGFRGRQHYCRRLQGFSRGLVQHQGNAGQRDGCTRPCKTQTFQDRHEGHLVLVNGTAGFITPVFQRIPHSGTAESAESRRFVRPSYQRPLRGRGWQTGQVWDDRFMNWSRRMIALIPAAAHRLHGSPWRP